MAELLGRGYESLPPDDDFTLLLFFGFVCISPGGPDLPHYFLSYIKCTTRLVIPKTRRQLAY